MIPGTIPMPSKTLPTITLLGTDDDDSGGSNHDHTINFGVGQPGDLIVVIAAWSASNNRTVIGITIDPSGASIGLSDIDTSGAAQQTGVNVRSGLANVSGSLTVRTSFLSSTEAVAIAVYRIRGQDSATPTDSDGNRASSSSSRSMNLDTLDGGIRVAGLCKVGTSDVTLSGVSEDGEFQFRSANLSRFAFGAAFEQPAATPAVVSASWSGSVACNIAGASYR